MTEELQGQEPTAPAGQVPDGETEPKQDTLSAEAVQAELTRARREAAKYRTELRKVQEAQEAKAQAEMSELEKLQAAVAKLEKRAEDAEANAKRMVVKTTATLAATKAGVRPDALDIVTALLDLDTLEVEEDGSVAGLEEAIQAIVKERPFLTAQDTKGRISPTNPAEGGVGETYEQKRQRIFYPSNNAMFGGRGGGVIMPTDK